MTEHPELQAIRLAHEAVMACHNELHRLLSDTEAHGPAREAINEACGGLLKIAVTLSADATQAKMLGYG